MWLILRHQTTRTWNEGSRKSSREKVEAGSRDRQERYRGKHRELWWAFVDLEKAFDRVPRRVVKWAMRKLGVEEWLERAVMAMYKHARTRIRSYGG